MGTSGIQGIGMLLLIRMAPAADHPRRRGAHGLGDPGAVDKTVDERGSICARPLLLCTRFWAAAEPVPLRRRPPLREACPARESAGYRRRGPLDGARLPRTVSAGKGRSSQIGQRPSQRFPGVRGFLQGPEDLARPAWPASAGPGPQGWSATRHGPVTVGPEGGRRVSRDPRLPAVTVARPRAPAMARFEGRCPRGRRSGFEASRSPTAAAEAENTAAAAFGSRSASGPVFVGDVRCACRTAARQRGGWKITRVSVRRRRPEGFRPSMRGSHGLGVSGLPPRQRRSVPRDRLPSRRQKKTPPPSCAGAPPGSARRRGCVSSWAPSRERSLGPGASCISTT